jgi:hypothetical protein
MPNPWSEEAEEAPPVVVVVVVVEINFGGIVTFVFA